MTNIATSIMSALGATHLLSLVNGKYSPSHTKKGPGRRRALTRLEAAFNVTEAMEDKLYKARTGKKVPRWVVYRAAAGSHGELVRDGYTVAGLQAEYVRLDGQLRALPNRAN